MICIPFNIIYAHHCLLVYDPTTKAEAEKNSLKNLLVLYLPGIKQRDDISCLKTQIWWAFAFIGIDSSTIQRVSLEKKIKLKNKNK